LNKKLILRLRAILQADIIIIISLEKYPNTTAATTISASENASDSVFTIVPVEKMHIYLDEESRKI